METNDTAVIAELAFEDAPVPDGVEMKPVRPATIPIDAYTSESYARLENEKLWGKVWQIACRTEEIPNVGDYVTYDIMNESIIVVRSAGDKIQAFYNVCQHRGRQLTEGCGHARQFICKFHGWRWKINGETAFVNDRKGYDGSLTDENTRLVSVKVDTWGGWVWINMDPASEPLLEYLEPVAKYLSPFQLEKMRYRWRQWLVFPCNWKTALEAFNESHHAAITHPQLCQWGAPAFYWCRAEGKHSWHGPAASTGPGRPGNQNMSASISSSLSNGPGRVADARIVTAQSLRATMEGVNSCTTDTMIRAADRLVEELPEGTPADVVAARFNVLAQSLDADRGVVWPELDQGLLPETGHDWHIFPNSVILQGITYALCYRARPNGSDPNSCIFDVYVIERYGEGEEPKTEWVNVPDPADERWPEVLQQDFNNMPFVQKGMQSRGFKGARPNPRQEVAVYNFHQVLSEYMGIGAPVESPKP
jgi:nitrite reductase/ring-hydroxylating ferredoxin subunit